MGRRELDILCPSFANKKAVCEILKKDWRRQMSVQVKTGNLYDSFKRKLRENENARIRIIIRRIILASQFKDV